MCTVLYRRNDAKPDKGGFLFGRVHVLPAEEASEIQEAGVAGGSDRGGLKPFLGGDKSNQLMAV